MVTTTHVAPARLAVAGGSAGAAVALAAAVTLSWPFARGQGYLLAVSLLALAALLAGLLGYWVDGLAWGIAALAAGFLFRLVLEPAAVSPLTPIAAAALVLVAELGYWSLEIEEGAMRAGRRLLGLGLAAIGAGAVAELALDLSLAAPPGGAWMLPAGVGAAVAATGILLVLARR